MPALYRNTFVMQSKNLHRRGDEEEAIRSYLYLAYLDANAPDNGRGKPFDQSSRCQAPHTMNMVRYYQEKNIISDQKLKEEFIKLADDDPLKATMPLKSKESWESFYKEYKGKNKSE
ncbi:hypothetical protein ACDX66_00855 [Peribacillus frigoritolerans]